MSIFLGKHFAREFLLNQQAGGIFYSAERKQGGKTCGGVGLGQQGAAYVPRGEMGKGLAAGAFMWPLGDRPLRTWTGGLVIKLFLTSE